MKTNNTDNQMMTAVSKTSLAVHKSAVLDSEGKELVIACGYTKGGKFGYFICKEHIANTGHPPSEVFKYSDQREFYQKENNHTYTAVLAKMKEILLDEATKP